MSSRGGGFEQILTEIYDEALANRTKRVSEAASRHAITAVYQNAGLAIPETWLWVDDPVKAAITIDGMKKEAKGERVGRQLLSCLCDPLGNHAESGWDFGGLFEFLRLASGSERLVPFESRCYEWPTLTYGVNAFELIGDPFPTLEEEVAIDALWEVWTQNATSYEEVAAMDARIGRAMNDSVEWWVHYLDLALTRGRLTLESLTLAQRSEVFNVYSLLNQLVRSCGVFHPFERVVVVTHNPLIHAWSPGGHAHADYGPAISYKGGWSVYARHGRLYAPPSHWREIERVVRATSIKEALAFVRQNMPWPQLDEEERAVVEHFLVLNEVDDVVRDYLSQHLA